MFSIFSTVKSANPSYATLQTIYVGFEDATFIGYYTIPVNSVAWRPADGSLDTTRFTYAYDAVTGKSTGGAITSSVFDCRVRPWYTAAKAAGVGIWSPTFTFSIGGNLAISYAVPIYDGVTFKGSTGLDFQLTDVDTILNGYNAPGAGIYIFETELTSATDAYQLIATSSNAPAHNVTSKVQFLAYQAEVQDYFIINSATYLKNNGVIADGVYSIDGIDIDVRNYVKYTLEWRFVKYTSTATAAGDVPTPTTTTAEEDDDDIATVLAVSGAILAILLVVAIVLIVAIVIFAKGNKSAMSSSAKDSNL
jgi:hypothetical protein